MVRGSGVPRRWWAPVDGDGRWWVLQLEDGERGEGGRLIDGESCGRAAALRSTMQTNGQGGGGGVLHEPLVSGNERRGSGTMAATGALYSCMTGEEMGGPGSGTDRRAAGSAPTMVGTGGTDRCARED
jgi:hypothetical protein